MTQSAQAKPKLTGDPLLDYLNIRKSALEARIAKGLSAERLIRIAHTAATKTPDLMSCPPPSIYMALMTAGQLGIEPNTAHKHGYLIPRYNSKTRAMECVFQVSYMGLIYTAIRSGSVRSVWAESVGENDQFDAPRGHNPDIIHRVNLRDPGETVAFYAVATMPDGSKKDALMSRAAVEKIRDAAGGKNGPSAIWQNHFEEMGKKTAIIRLMKTIGVGPALSAALEEENDDLEGDEEPIAAQGQPAGAPQTTARGGQVASRARTALGMPGPAPAQLPEGLEPGLERSTGRDVEAVGQDAG